MTKRWEKRFNILPRRSVSSQPDWSLKTVGIGSGPDPSRGFGSRSLNGGFMCVWVDPFPATPWDPNHPNGADSPYMECFLGWRDFWLAELIPSDPNRTGGP